MEFYVTKTQTNEYENFYETDKALNGEKQAPTLVGHVHLKVGDISTAKAFYSDKLGFDVTMEFGPQAIFFSAGGYHHHIGANTWYSNGSGPRTPALGLGQTSIILPDEESLAELQEKLIHHKVQLQVPEENTILFNDPWLNTVTVTVKIN